MFIRTVQLTLGQRVRITGNADPVFLYDDRAYTGQGHDETTYVSRSQFCVRLIAADSPAEGGEIELCYHARPMVAID